MKRKINPFAEKGNKFFNSHAQKTQMTQNKNKHKIYTTARQLVND